MANKKSKKKSKEHLSAPADPVAVDYYPKTAVAFDSLIMAYVEAESVLRVAGMLRDELENVARMKITPRYVRLPDDDAPEDVKAEIARRRQGVPSGLRRMTELADAYFRVERIFRRETEKAKVAVDAAAVELDSPQTPPLRRTSIAIRRALRNLSGSVPYPMTAAWAEATEPRVLEGIATTARRVSVWIEELRLLVRPRHTMPPPLGWGQAGTAAQPSAQPAVSVGSRNPKRARRGASATRDEQRRKLSESRQLPALADALTTFHIEILRALKQYSAVTADDVASKAALCANVLKTRTEKSMAKPLNQLKALDLVNSSAGRSGGYWITSNGLAVLQYRDEPHHVRASPSAATPQGKPEG
jgi:hypothetical protein